MEQKRVSFHTLGCKLNFSESSTLAREFERGGYLRVESSEPTDVAVINSCSVTEHADKKCRLFLFLCSLSQVMAPASVRGPSEEEGWAVFLSLSSS